MRTIELGPRDELAIREALLAQVDQMEQRLASLDLTKDEDQIADLNNDIGYLLSLASTFGFHPEANERAA
jgi:hypothetical protein